MYLLLLAVCGFSQLKEDSRQHTVPKYISRQKDFYEKRVAAGGETNMAKAFYEAGVERRKFENNRLAKKSNAWTPKGPFGTDFLAGIGRVNDIIFDPIDTATYYICVGQGGLWKTRNSGVSWINISGDLPILRTSSLAIDPTNPLVMYVALGDYAYLGHNIYANGSKRNSHYGLGIYKTMDGGFSWKPTGLSFELTDYEGSLISKIILNPSNPNKLLAVGQKGAFYSEDAGANWQQTDSNLFWDLEIDPLRPNRVYATTGYLSTYKIGNAGILYSNDFGFTWTKSKVPFKSKGFVQRIEIAQSPSDPSYLYAVACDIGTVGLSEGFYGFYLSTDTGKTWITKQDSSYQYNMLGWEFDKEPGGQGRYDLALVVDQNNKNKVSLGGVNIWTTSDGGSTFLPSTFWRLNYQFKSLHADVHSLKQHPGGRIFACHDGGVSATNAMIGDNPVELTKGDVVSTQWEHFTNGLNITSFYRLSVNSELPNNLMAGAQDNSTSTSNNGVWYNLSGGDGMECTYHDDNAYVYTSSQYGTIYRFDYDQSSTNFTYNDRLSSPFDEQGEWTTPFVSNGVNLLVGYGNLYEYDNFSPYGTQLSTFSIMPGFNYPKPISALAISSNKGANNLYLSKRSYPLNNIQGEVWVYKNFSTWENISGDLPLQNYPSYLYTLNSAGNEVWVTFSGFEPSKKVYYSSDEGKTWTNISYNLPNIPVNCIAVQDDVTRNIYVGTDHGVYYLNTKLKEWVLYSEGLPNVIVSELEIHPKSSRLMAATFGAGVWEVSLASIDSTVSVSNIDLSDIEVKLSPNPAKDHLKIHLQGITKGNYSLRIIDITGKEIYNKTLVNTTNQHLETINISQWLSGEFFVILESANDRRVARFIKL